MVYDHLNITETLILDPSEYRLDPIVRNTLGKSNSFRFDNQNVILLSF